MLNHEAASLLAGLSAAFPSAKLPPETLRLYCNALERLPYDSTRDAVDEIVQTSHRFPTIAAIREAQQRHQARHLDRERQRHMALPAPDQPDEAPLTNAERRQWAETLATEAAAIRARGGSPYWADYLGHLAERYADNAARGERGQPVNTRFRITDLLRPMTGR